VTRDLTDQQRSLAKAQTEAFAEACPGAGKTRATVARVLELQPQLAPRHGLAVLSFTNSAVEEFDTRCRQEGMAHLLRFPTFVGTFDAFVRTFLVLPFGVSGCSVRPTTIDSWRSLAVDIRLSGNAAFRGDGVSLDLFSPETGAIDPARIRVLALREHVTAHRASYESAARARRDGLHRAGYFTVDDLRVEAARLIRHREAGKALGCALAARFFEVVVDEAQDCNPLDLEILGWLRGHRVRVTVICDPDQAIYEFRHGVPQDLRAFGATYPVERRYQLTGNFRSSVPITRLAATLRSREDPDQALGQTAAVAHPVLLAGYAGPAIPAAVGRVFADRLQAVPVGLPVTDGIILAHRWSDAHRAAGLPLRHDGGDSRVERIARAVGGFWAPSATSASRRTVLSVLERLVLEAQGHWKDGDRHPSRVAERAGLNGRQLRRNALGLLMRLPKTCDGSEASRTAWIASLRTAVIDLGVTRPQGMTVTQFLRCPPGGDWIQHLVHAPDDTVRCSTVHEAKGREYQAVCVVLRPDRAPEHATATLVDSWEGRTDLEAKRVLYVGVTRARQFVMVAIPIALVDRCADILNCGNVPFERVTIT
jgi:superfamily I DNA/RNA helicase